MKNRRSLQSSSTHKVIVNNSIVQLNFRYFSPTRNVITFIDGSELLEKSHESSLILEEGRIQTQQRMSSHIQRSSHFYQYQCKEIKNSLLENYQEFQSKLLKETKTKNQHKLKLLYRNKEPLKPTNNIPKMPRGSPKKINITLPSKAKPKIIKIRMPKRGQNSSQTPNKRKFEVYSSSSTKGRKSQNNSAEKSKRTAPNQQNPKVMISRNPLKKQKFPFLRKKQKIRG